MSLLHIKSLQVASFIGVHAWEKQIPQSLWVDLEISYDLRKAAASDRIEDALDYSHLAEHIHTFAANQRAGLMERWVSLLADSLAERFQLTKFTLTVHKPQAIGRASDVAITVTRPDID